MLLFYCVVHVYLVCCELVFCVLLPSNDRIVSCHCSYILTHIAVSLDNVLSYRDEQAMKKIGYRILEFGRFNWDSVMSGFAIYKEAYGHIDIPHEVSSDDVI